MTLKNTAAATTVDVRKLVISMYCQNMVGITIATLLLSVGYWNTESNWTSNDVEEIMVAAKSTTHKSTILG